MRLTKNLMFSARKSATHLINFLSPNIKNSEKKHFFSKKGKKLGQKKGFRTFLTSESLFYDSLMSHVMRHPKKVVKMLAIAMTCEIVRGIKILTNTTQYCLILHSIAQYCPIFFHIVQYCQILSSNVQYCPVLLYIIRLAILAFFRSSFYNVMSDSIKHCSILSSISLHSLVVNNIGQL